MINLISLHTLNQIFETDSLIQLSAKARVAYMQCLTYYFSDMEPKMINLKSFDMLKQSVNPKSLPIFSELEKAGLVQVNDKTITFINHWHKYIDKSKLEKVSPEEYLGLLNHKKAEDYRDEILNNQSFAELLQMQLKLQPIAVHDLIMGFFNEMEATKKSFPNYQSASMECLRWIKKEVRYNPPKQSVIQTAIETRNTVHERIKQKHGSK